MLPPEVANRRKSIYPASADPEYGRLMKAQMTDLLARPSEPVFDLFDRDRLAEAFAADPSFPGLGRSAQPLGGGGHPDRP